MIDIKSFGKLSDGKEVKLFTLKNDAMSVSLTEYGASIVSIITPDRNGSLADVVLGFDDVTGYENQKNTYMGATVGRFANRIRGGRFMLNGKPIVLNRNDGNNHLHGGLSGFDRKVFESAVDGDNSVIFTYISADREENFPGNVRVTVRYTLNDANSLTIKYTVISDADTVINLTNHSYFNLKGHSAGGADSQILRINADKFTGIDSEIIPDGSILPLECTPMDFRNYKRISEHIDSPYIQMKFADGYDHNWVLNKRERNILSLAAELYDEISGRYMTVHTTQPGLQFYSGNFLNGIQGKCNMIYKKRDGICLEPQFFPNSMEHTYFPSPILKVGDEYTHTTRYSFSIKNIDEKCFS